MAQGGFVCIGGLWLKSKFGAMGQWIAMWPPASLHPRA